MSYTIDLQVIADKLDFDLEDVKMLIEVFLEGTEESLNNLKNAIQINDFDAIFRSAHAIKGSAANLTLSEISNIAKEMEANAREELEFNYQDAYEKLKLLINSISA